MGETGLIPLNNEGRNILASRKQTSKALVVLATFYHTPSLLSGKHSGHVFKGLEF